MGVYKNFDGTQKKVAVKTIKASSSRTVKPEVLEKNQNDFKEEIKLMVKLSHRHVVDIIGQVQHGQCFGQLSYISACSSNITYM